MKQLSFISCFPALLLSLTACCFSVMTAGCGGNQPLLSASSEPSGGGNASRGRATISIRWPEPSRLIPVAASSLRIEIRDSAGQEVGTQLLPRPAQGGTVTATFDPLPLGNLTATATAFPSADGSGVAQATVATQLLIQAGQTTNFRIAPISTIDHVEVMPASLTLNPGQTLPVTVTAKNTAGEVVLTNPSTLTWVTQNPAVATVRSGGTGGFVTSTGSGSTTLTITETESGKSANATVMTGIYDDFNDNQRNASLWQIASAGTGPTATEVNQRLEITVPANSANRLLFGAGFRTRCALHGDFDVQVDYDLLAWPTRNGIRVGLWLGDVSSVPHVASTHRVSLGGGDPAESYAGVHSFDTATGRLATTATTGTLRLVRTSGVFSCYYRDATTNQWVLLINGGNNNSDRPLTLFAWSNDADFSHVPVKVAFDNFVVNKGDFACGP
jgi:hypothetical protein